MEFIKDLVLIKKNALSNEKENWNFIEYLKKLDENNVVKISIDIYNEIKDFIKCTDCGNCCKENIPILDNYDISKIAKHLNCSKDDFINKYLNKHNKYNIFLMNQIPCPFLNSNVCSVYNARFASCRAYPELTDIENILSIGNIIKNSSICPIIYNFYEILKNRTTFNKSENITC